MDLRSEPHLVLGKLSGGRTYFLVEEEAPEGYSAADPVMFTVSADGRSIAEISGASSLIQILYDAEKGQDRIDSCRGDAGSREDGSP